MIIPETDLILLKVPINIDSANQLNFANKEAQYNYFNSLEKDVEVGFTYQRKDNVIRYNACMDDIIEFNYCMYRNNNYSDKWFYAYIESMEYANDEMTYIKIKTDVYQTWQFDIDIKASFVEREHVNNDTIGLHTVPEQLETGEYINNKALLDFTYDETCYICIATTEPIETSDRRPASQATYNRIYSGLVYNIVKTAVDANYIIDYLDNDGRGEIINALFIVPSILCPNASMTKKTFTYGSLEVEYYWLTSPNSATNFGNISIVRPTKIGNNYSPKNNKLFTFPYSYFNITNNCGTTVTYQYENFSNINSISFNVQGAFGAGCSIRAIPANYKGVTANYEEGINGAKLPICAWSSDVYTNWLTQNSVNNAVSIGTSALQVVGGIGLLATGGGALAGAGMLSSGALGIAGKVGQIYEHSFTANQASGNTNNADVIFAMGKSDFSCYYMSIKDEYAKIIDGYFSMFGYKVSELKVPNTTGRRNWNFIKTIDCNIEAYIPQNDLLEIKDLFNKGITIWHNPSTFLDYSQNNDIIS